MPHLTLDILQLLEERLGKEEAKKVATKGDIHLLKAELEARIEKEISSLEVRMEKEISKLREDILRLDKKFTIMFLILLFAIIFLNKDALEFIARLFGLLR
ncbi:MAG: hypothetical protein ACK4LT_01780 [Aquificaceae bacterium]